MINKITKVVVLSFVFLCNPLHGQWVLDSAQSEITYLSTKVVAGGQASVTERNHFSGLTGVLNGDGQAEVIIDLTRVETHIPIRNERMQQHVFNTDKTPHAVVSVNVPAGLMEPGIHTDSIDATLAINGLSKKLHIPVTVYVDKEQISVTSREPMLLQAADIGMSDGLKKLAEIAKLLHIPTVVPVSFSLRFTQ